MKRHGKIPPGRIAAILEDWVGLGLYAASVVARRHGVSQQLVNKAVTRYWLFKPEGPDTEVLRLPSKV